MVRKIKWGILGAAKIAITRLIPAIAQAENAEITAVSSRDISKAKDLAMENGIPLVFGDYDAMINDPQIDAVYIPLPNHLHVEYAKKCLAAGKHVLCEKPLAISKKEIEELIKLRDETGLKVGEAFMVDSHPQWSVARRIIENGELGEVKLLHGSFSYVNKNPENVRNKYKEGGGALWDIGCYPLHTARLALGKEPEEVIASMEIDPDFGTDRLSTAIVKFQGAQLLMSAATQTAPAQMMRIYGEKKWMEFSIAYTPVVNENTEMYIYENGPEEIKKETVYIDSCNQYEEMIRQFSNAIIDDSPVPVSLEDTYKNTLALLAMIKSAKSGKWEKP